MTSDANADQPPAWARELAEAVAFLTSRIDDVESALGDINQQLQAIGGVDEYGHPL